jgi:hypothetical protein
MKITVDPPLDQWALAKHDKPVIATGHQASLWHPGILAKYIATTHAAKKFNAQPLHIVVDQDQHETMALDIPVVKGNQLAVNRVSLGKVNAHVPTGMQPPIDVDESTLDSDGVLALALREIGPCKTLAQQVTALLAKLYQPYIGDINTIFASQLLRESPVVDQMLVDVRDCIAHYNRAVAEYPQAGIEPLAMRDDRVELPLWRLLWNQPRRRVFADDGGALIDELGEAITDQNQLAPRALLLTAVMRSERCSLFIHGTGGFIYDHITELWWRGWRKEALAPMAMVTADLRLDFDVPVCDRQELTQATWWMHHLPHNIDRALSLDGDNVKRKHDLLQHMDDDHNSRRRADSFRELHAINAHLAQENAQVVKHAAQRLEDARAGVTNRTIALRRDWCFALYPPQQLESLVQTMVV